MKTEARSPIEVCGVETLIGGWNIVRRYHLSSLDQGGCSRKYQREVVHRPDMAVILPYSSVSGNVVLVQQVRLAPYLATDQFFFLEAPSGRIDSGETPIDAAKREVLEETGLPFPALEEMGVFFMHPALSTERAHLFVGDYGSASAASIVDHPDELSPIVPFELPLERVADMCRGGEISDMKTVLLVGRLREKLGRALTTRNLPAEETP
jgi:ADP-ribose pyrophosphatase